MRILFVVDARSPIAQSWMSYFIAGDHEVHIVSTYATTATHGAASFNHVPVAFTSRVAAGKRITGAGNLKSGGIPGGGLRGSQRILRESLSVARHWLSPVSLQSSAATLRRIIAQISPAVVHAMRIPYEGVLAAEAMRGLSTPLVLSVWGNDFTLFAKRFPVVRWLTRRALGRADMLHSDCSRDVRLALELGFSRAKPSFIAPGAGGIDTSLFDNVLDRASLRGERGPGRWLIVFPRRFRPGSVRTDVFFNAVLDLQLSGFECDVVCPGMAGVAEAEAWRASLPHPERVQLLTVIPRTDMAKLFQTADVSVSPSEHDGTPNSLLEAMACGAFPVVGDIESVREWISHGENGLLCDPTSHRNIAAMIRASCENEPLRERAARFNRVLVQERASYGVVMRRVADLYSQVVGSGSAPQNAETGGPVDIGRVRGAWNIAEGE